MTKFLLAFLMLIFGKNYAQNKLQGLILDLETLQPIEYADIYNNKGSTSSNADGKFWFQSVHDSINIRLIGYEPIHSTFEKLRSDKIYLQRKSEFLDEIVLSESHSIRSVNRNIYTNYPTEPFTESFFLRCVLKKDGQIIKLQDLSGLVGRKILFPTPQIHFELFSFEEFLTAITNIEIDTERFKFNQNKYDDGKFIKHRFSPKDTTKMSTKGYYLADVSDNAFNEFYSLNIDNNRNFEENRGIKYRTVYYEFFVTFKKDYTKQKYFIDKAKLRAKVEAIEKDKKPILFEAEYLWIVSGHTYRNIENKTPLSKDIFTLTTNYNEQFWKVQNHLLLTDEMQSFIENLEGAENNFKTVTKSK